MKLTVDTKFAGKVLVSTLIGGFVGLGFALWRGNNVAILLCAIGAGVLEIRQLRKQQNGKK